MSEGSRDLDPATLNSSSPPLKPRCERSEDGGGGYHVLVNFTVLGFSHDEDGAGGGMGDRAGDLVEKEI